MNLINFGESICILNNGIENEFYFNKIQKINRGVIYNFKRNSYLFVMLICILFIKRKKIADCFIIANGKHQEKILSGKYHQIVFIGNSLKCLSKLSRSVYNYLSFYDVCRLLMLSLKNVKKYRLYDCFDLLTLELLLSNSNLDIVILAGHFDKYTTWISYLSERYDKKIHIIQHGTLAKEFIPNKIYCNKFFCINEFEADVYENYVLKEGSRCEFEINNDFKYLKLQKSPSDDSSLKVAISTEIIFIDETRMILDIISKYKNVITYLYVHPLVKPKEIEKRIKMSENIIIESTNRYYDIDILFTYPSTLIYDYYYSKQFRGKIVCVNNMLERQTAVLNVPNLKVVNVVDEYSISSVFENLK